MPARAMGGADFLPGLLRRESKILHGLVHRNNVGRWNIGQRVVNLLEY